MIENRLKLKQEKCQVCNSTVMIDEWMNGETCLNCGWCQDGAAVELPHQIGLANSISLNKAKQLYSEAKH